MPTAGSRVLPLATGSLAEASVERIMVVAWGAEWCRYCRENKPELKRLSESGRYVIMYVDYDTNREMAKRYNVTSLPTYFVVVGDEVVLRTSSIETLKAYKPQRE